MTALVLSVFLVGCPKRPEVTETAPKAIGPQGAIAMPAPPPPPPTVSGVAPTVPPPEDQESPTEVTAQAEEVEAAEPEAPVEEVEAPAAERTETMPPGGEVSPSQSADSGGRPEASIEEGQVSPTVEEEKGGVSAEAQAPIEGGELRPEASSPISEVDAGSGTEAQVTGGGVTVPSPVEPSTEGPSSEAPAGAGDAAPVEAAPVTTPSAPPAPVSEPPAPAPELDVVAEAPRPPEITVKDIFFDFDQAAIREDSRKTLADNVQWLRANAAVKVTIEGHCDERGSSEYNLALGERRARVTQDFLVAAGIDASRISTISYGKERPFVLGHDESAWKWNRRAHFVMSTK